MIEKYIQSFEVEENSLFKTLSYLYPEISEDHDGYGRIDLKPITASIKLEPLVTKVQFTSAQEKMLSSNFGVDISTLVRSTLSRELKSAFTKQIVDEIKRIAGTFDNTKKAKWMGKIFGYNPPIKPNTKELLSAILSASSIINERCRMGPGDFVLASKMEAAILQDCPGFIYNDTGNVILTSIGDIEELGSIGNLKILVSAYEQAGNILVGKKTEDSQGGIYHIYSKPKEIGSEVINPDMSVKKELLVLTNHKIYSTLEAGNFYMKLKVSYDKHPFRKYLIERIKEFLNGRRNN